MRDQFFAAPQPQIVDFAFDQAVVGVFPDMIRRSVPGYELILPMSGLIAARHMGPAGTAFDLGCSWVQCPGAADLLPKPGHSGDRRGQLQAMIDEARKQIQDPVEFRYQDLFAVDVSGAKVVMLNFVLQFLEPLRRSQLLTEIAQRMDPAGLLILSEKVLHADADTHAFYDATHLAWKQANGYSELEVSQKRQALENVMR